MTVYSTGRGGVDECFRDTYPYKRKEERNCVFYSDDHDYKPTNGILEANI